MAAFVAKQMVGNKLNAVKGAVGGDDDSGTDKEKEEEAERERLEAIREAEERRKEKHRKMEEEREKIRQEIRDKGTATTAMRLSSQEEKLAMGKALYEAADRKDSINERYNIKKKEEVAEQQETEPPNPLMRKKKTPEELAAEAAAEDEDDFTKLKNTLETHVTEIKSQIESKCSVQ